MRSVKITICFAAVLTFCQTAASQESAAPESQALGNKLLQEINAGISCAAANITLKQQLEAAQRRIKALSEKPVAEQKPETTK